MSASPATIRIGLFALASVLALAAGAWFSGRLSVRPAAPEIGGYILDQPREIAPFEMLDGDSEPFRNADFEKAWSFLFFGYTYCPDACPLTMVVFTNMKASLAGQPGDFPVRYYLVSVDPARDLPERIGEYVEYFDSEFRGLTGPYVELDKLTAAAGVAYIPPDSAAGDDYLVDHSSSITLLDPDGKIHAIFTPPHDADAIARDFLLLHDRY